MRRIGAHTNVIIVDVVAVIIDAAVRTNTGRIITRMKHGVEVTILEPGTTWTKVDYNGSVGYCMTVYLK